MEKIKVGIFGSCISRDIFNYDIEQNFEVQSFINFNSIIAQMSQPAFAVSEEDIGHKSNWFSRIIATDINKNALDMILQARPDYLIIDLMSERLDLLKVLINNQETLLTLHNDLLKTNLFCKGGELYNYDVSSNVVQLESYDDLFLDFCIRKFCAKIRKVMPEERIIFIESFKVREYIDKIGVIHKFDEEKMKINRTNNMLHKLENYMSYYLGDCNFVYFPINTIADEKHHLNLTPTHYCPNYYKYALEVIENICFPQKSVSRILCDNMKMNNEVMKELLIRKG